MNVHLLNLIFILLLGLLFFLWYLFFRIKKWYLILIFLIILLLIFYYYTYIFDFLFGWNLNFYWFFLGLIFIIFAVVAIILSLLKNKIYFLIFTTIFLSGLFIDSLKYINKNVEDSNLKNYYKLAKEIVINKWDISEKQKEQFMKLSNEDYFAEDYSSYRLDALWVNVNSIKKAKQILWMYDFEYCKKYNSERCYIEFIYWKSLLDTNKSFSEKYSDYTMEFWKYIKKDMILEWLNEDLKKNIKLNLERELKHISTYNNLLWSVANSDSVDIFIYRDKITLKKHSGNIRLKKYNSNVYDIDKTKELINERINYLKNNYISDLTHEKLKENNSRKHEYDILWLNDWITVKLSISEYDYVLWYDIPMDLYLNSQEDAFKYFHLIYSYLLQTSIATDDIIKTNIDN